MVRHFLAALALLVALSPAQADELALTIDRAASLTEQVLLEADLRRQPHVTQLLPLRLAPNERSYRVRTTDDGAWLGRWLSQHGFSVERTRNGWRAF